MDDNVQNSATSLSPRSVKMVEETEDYQSKSNRRTNKRTANTLICENMVAVGEAFKRSRRSLARP